MDSVVVLVVWTAGSLTVVQEASARTPASVNHVMIILVMELWIYLSDVVVVVVVDFDSSTLAAGTVTLFLTMTFEATRFSPSLT